MKTYATLIILFNTLFLAGQSSKDPAIVDYFTDNGFGAAVKTMQHPAGEYYKGVTYVCFQGPLEDAWVAAYNHATNKWSGPFKAGVSKLGKTPGDKIDNHGKPAMIIDNEGYIHIVFGGHGGMPEHGPNTLGNTHKGDMIHVVSQKPQDISRWEVLDNIPPFGTYNQFVKMDNGDIYLFYRHGAHRSNWVYQKSTNNGRSFEQEVSILKHKIQDDNPGIHDSWYCWFTKGQGEEIIMTYNYHVCKDLNHDGERQNCYYMVMNTNDYTWRNVKGEVLTVPVTKAHADKMTLVVDTENKWTTRGTVRLDQAGNPHLTYNEGEHMGLKHGGPRQVKYYRWTGQMWDGGYDTNLPVSAVGDILISSPTEVNLLLDGRGEVAWWHTTNGGQSFTKGEVLIRQEKTNFAITSWLRNAHPNARVVAVGKIGSSDFRKMYLLGDEGPVKRLKAEADKLDD